jgi:hypothetical protein
MLRSPTLSGLLRSVLVLLVLSLAALGLVACGSGSAADKSVDELLSQTFGSDKAVRSGRIDAALDISPRQASSRSSALRLALRGPFQSQGKGKIPKFDLSLSFKRAGQTVSAGVVSTGDKGFLKLGRQAYDVGDQLYKRFAAAYLAAQKKSGGKDGTSLKSLGIDPRGWLKDARKVGEAKIAGADTIRISAGIDVPKLLQDVDSLLAGARQLGVTGAPDVARLTAEQRQDIARAVRSAAVDIYTGKDDTILRRLALKVGLDVPADARRSLGGLTSGSLALDLTINEVNEAQSIDAPKGAKPLAELTAGLGGLLGGTSGAGTSPSPSSGAGAAASSQRYLECAQAAGSDVAKLQSCAKFLK